MESATSEAASLQNKIYELQEAFFNLSDMVFLILARF